MFLFRAIDFAAWACPTCGRVLAIPANDTWVVCGGGWRADGSLLHPPVNCVQVPDFMVDPLELYDRMVWTSHGKHHAALP